MSLRSEAKEAAAKTASNRGFSGTAAAIRNEDWDTHVAYPALLAATKAVLAVVDKYEEVKMQVVANNPNYLRVRDGNVYWQRHEPSFTVYRKKQEPKPDVTELARRAVKARRSGTRQAECDAFKALAEAVDE